MRAYYNSEKFSLDVYLKRENPQITPWVDLPRQIYLERKFSRLLDLENPQPKYQKGMNSGVIQVTRHRYQEYGKSVFCCCCCCLQKMEDSLFLSL